MKSFLFFFSILLFLGNKVCSQTKVDCANAKTQAEMTLCARQDFSEADKQLNVIYKNVIAKCNARQRAALIKTQKAWLLYRDENATMHGLIYEGGSMEPMTVWGAKATATLARIKELESLLDELGL